MKIILFDDHELFSEGLKEVLKKNAINLLTYHPRVYFDHIVKKEVPDLILLDIHLGEKHGILEGKRLLKDYPKLKIIFLSGFPLINYCEEAKDMGAKGFIHKCCSVEELLHKIHLVYYGNTVFPNYENLVDQLTTKEKEILQLLAEGYTQQEVAHKITVSKRTVATHLQHVFSKLDVHSTISAIVRGIELGIVRIRI